eukprot:557729-Rhodomonas_salina.1
MNREVSGYSALWTVVSSTGCGLPAKCTGTVPALNVANCNAFLEQHAACEPACLCSDAEYIAERERAAQRYADTFGCTIKPGCGAKITGRSEQSVVFAAVCVCVCVCAYMCALAAYLPTRGLCACRY